MEGGIANSVGDGSSLALPPTHEPGVKKRRKNFIKGVMNKRSEVNEQTLFESGGKVIDQLKAIVDNASRGEVHFDNGESKVVSPENAQKIVRLYKELNASNRTKMITSINNSPVGFMKIFQYANTKY